jgi:sulfite exporter TauE/SafE
MITLELITTALILGLLGSAHCIGMCGPLALAVPSPGNSFGARLGGTLALNSGRMITYGLIGAGFGLFGRGLQLAGLQQVVSIALGVIILAGLLAPQLLRALRVERSTGTVVMRLQGVMARHLKRTSPEGLFFTGMLNGLLPCGLLYLAAAGAMAQIGWAQGTLFMVFFGLGTWPALVGLRLSGSYAGPGFRTVLRKATPYAYAIMGILFILRGLDLGIPFLSPDLPDANSAAEACHVVGIAP